MEDRWFGNAFQIFEATDENDLEAAADDKIDGNAKSFADRTLKPPLEIGIETLLWYYPMNPIMNYWKYVVMDGASPISNSIIVYWIA